MAWVCILLCAGTMQAQTSAPQSAARPATPAAGQPVQPIPLAPAAVPKQPQRKSRYQVSVSGDGWQASGVELEPGDQVKFQASGSMTLSDGRQVTPAGGTRGWRDLLRIYPLSSANSGALIGRIGKNKAALPFAIADSDVLTAPTAGELYLRANVSPDLTAQGTYKVRIDLEPAKSGTTGDAESAAFVRQLSPALFADIPRRVSDNLGNQGDMVNFALVGTEEQVKADLAKAGWFPTDANTQDALVHGLLQTLEHKSYMAVPMSTLYLFGRPQDLAYARGNAIEVAATRNHLRLWKSDETVMGAPLWVGSATHDHGFETDQRTGGVTHHIDPNIDQEREFIVSSLNDAGAARAAAYVLPSHPVQSAHTATGGTFNTDGRIAVILLR